MRSAFSFKYFLYTIQDSLISMITPLDDRIDNGCTQIHIFYALKMDEKYRERYLKHFKDPVIHEQDLRHEELLAVYPDKWCELIRKICL